MACVRLNRVLLLTLTIGGCLVSGVASNGGAAAQDGCKQKAAEQYMQLLFPDDSRSRIVALRGQVDAVQVDLRDKKSMAGILNVPESQFSVFKSYQAYLGEVGNDTLKPKIFLFKINKGENLLNYKWKYSDEYHSVLSSYNKNLLSVKSDACDLYALHNSGSIKRAVIVARYDKRIDEYRNSNIPIKDRAASYEAYGLPVDICITKAAIALNGAWGIFDYPESYFTYSFPSIIEANFNDCFNRLNTSSIRPGMNKEQVRKRLLH